MKKIKALERSNNQLLSCLNYSKAYEDIDLRTLEQVQASEHYGIEVWGEPALSIADGVATIKVRGLLAPNIGVDVTSYGLTGYDVIEHYLAVANDDKGVNSIVLDVDSGGGYVKGVHQASEAIKNSSKPVNTYVSGDMYSAAYWLGVSAKSITTEAHSGVGSIGVYVEHYDWSKRLEEMGVIARIFRSGKWKGAYSSDRPLSQEEQDRLQESIEASAQKFFNHVASNTRLSSADVKSFEGDVFSAEEAYKIGLIDGISEGPAVSSTGRASAEEQTEVTQQIQTDRKGDSEMDEKQKAQLRAEVEAEVRAEYEAKIKAEAERVSAINALEATDAVKAVLAKAEFASVSVEALTALAEAMPKTFTQAMEETGGAGIEADPKSFDAKTDDEAKAKAEEAKAKLAELAKSKKGVL